jgi:hypothetical protein
MRMTTSPITHLSGGMGAWLPFTNKSDRAAYNSKECLGRHCPAGITEHYVTDSRSTGAVLALWVEQS